MGRTLRMPGAGPEPLDVVVTREAPAVLSRELRGATRLPHHTVKRYLKELEELEYIAVTRGVRGAACAYRLVEMEDKPPEGQPRVRGLLSVEELAKKLAMKGGARRERES